jgi:putative copper export protein
MRQHTAKVPCNAALLGPGCGGRGGGWNTRTVLSITLEDFRLFLHVLAATVWVGGQITLAGLVPVLRKAGADVPKSVAQQFNRIAWPAFGVLIITGFWNISADHDEIHHNSDFRTTLWVKLGFVVLSGVSAYLHTKAASKAGRAVWGAGTAVFALGALLFGLVLSNG